VFTNLTHHPAGRTTSRTTLTATTAAAALILALTGCSTSGTGTDAPSSEQSAGDTTGETAAAEAPAEEPAAEPEGPGIGTPVTSGSFEFTVTAITDAGTTVGSEYLTQTAQGTYVQVDLSIANVGTKSETFVVNYLTLIDAEGREFDADSTATIYASPDANTWITGINPGNAVQGPVLFDVPAGTIPVSLTVTDSLFGGGETILLK